MFNQYSILSLFIASLFLILLIVCLVKCSNNNYIKKNNNDSISNGDNVYRII